MGSSLTQQDVAIAWFALHSGFQAHPTALIPPSIMELFTDFAQTHWEPGDEAEVLDFFPGPATLDKDVNGVLFRTTLRHFRRRLFTLAILDGRLAEARRAISGMNKFDLQDIWRAASNFRILASGDGRMPPMHTPPGYLNAVLRRIHGHADLLADAAGWAGAVAARNHDPDNVGETRELNALSPELCYFTERLQCILLVAQQRQWRSTLPGRVRGGMGCCPWGILGSEGNS